VTILATALVPCALAKYGGGSGTPDDPYLIRTPHQMNAIGADSNDWDKHFLLVNDISLSKLVGTEFNIIGNPYTPHFTGVFDGNGHVISNFSYASQDANFIGLFVAIGGGGKVSSLRVQDVNVSANAFTGGLAGMNSGTISDCYTSGIVRGQHYTGGLVGMNYGSISDCGSTGFVAGNDCSGGLVGRNSGTISACDSASTVAGEDFVGGLVGRNNGTILDCYANSSVDGNSVVGGLGGDNTGLISSSCATAEVSGAGSLTGGLVGWNLDGTVAYCHTTGNVHGNNGTGGAIGWNIYSTISNCYSLSSVLGDEHTGGLVGVNSTSTISNCYSAGVVDGNDDTGGLIGADHRSTITDCFWDVENSGQTSSDGGTGKTTSDMQDANTFMDAGWDFNTPIWKMCAERDYPRLWWERCPEPPIEAEVDIEPKTLNLRSRGKWMSCQIWLPEGYDVADIDLYSVFLEDEIQAERTWFNEQKQVALARFRRWELNQILAEMGAQGQVELTVNGQLADGTVFEGTDTIKVIGKTARMLTE
jgi:hypothetical protein